MINPLGTVCQATQLPYATSNAFLGGMFVSTWKITPREMWGCGRIVCGLVYSMYYNLSQAGIGLGPAMRWFYNTFHWTLARHPIPRRYWSIPEGQPTPTVALNLQPGELVRVKSHDEILKTLNTASKNRGMAWDAEMVPYCGKTYRVLARVTRIINEKTGEMQEMKTPCIILDSVVCQSRYSHCRMFCPRSIYSYWREIWLERVASPHSRRH